MKDFILDFFGKKVYVGDKVVYAQCVSSHTFEYRTAKVVAIHHYKSGDFAELEAESRYLTRKIGYKLLKIQK